MHYPYCERCHTGNNYGDRICGNCLVTLDFVKRFNTAFDRFKGNRRKLYEYFGFSQRTFFFNFIQSIPEIAKFWDDMEYKAPDDISKLINCDGKVRNQLSVFHVRMCKRLLKEYEYYNLSEEKQKEFMNWVISHRADEITIKEAQEKLLEYNSNQEVIKL